MKYVDEVMHALEKVKTGIEIGGLLGGERGKITLPDSFISRATLRKEAGGSDFSPFLLVTIAHQPVLQLLYQVLVTPGMNFSKVGRECCEEGKAGKIHQPCTRGLVDPACVLPQKHTHTGTHGYICRTPIMYGSATPS